MNKKKLPRAIQPTARTRAGAGAVPGGTGQQPSGRRRMPKRDMREAASPDAAEMTPEGRRAVAVKLVERFSLWSGAAGLIPVPFVDLAAVGGVQIQMLRRISQIYGVPFSRKPRQGAHSQPCRIDDPGEQWDRSREHIKERASCWNGY